jgi:hypothetical protein
MTKCRTEMNYFHEENELVLVQSVPDKIPLILSFKTRKPCYTAISISDKIYRPNNVKTVIVSREVFNENQYHIDHG